MLMEEELTLDGEHTVQCIDDGIILEILPTASPQ